MCTGRNFRVFKEGCFFSCLQLIVFTHNGMETWKSTDGDVVVFYGVEIFMAFSFIWDVYVAMDIVKCRMIVWHGSYQVKCDQRKSRCGVVRR